MPDPGRHHEERKGHGRREPRTVQLTGIKAGIGFPHAHLAARIIRTRTEVTTGANSTETVYAVTSLDWHHATPAELAAAIRGHWPSRTVSITSAT